MSKIIINGTVVQEFDGAPVRQSNVKVFLKSLWKLLVTIYLVIKFVLDIVGGIILVCGIGGAIIHGVENVTEKRKNEIKH